MTIYRPKKAFFRRRKIHRIYDNPSSSKKNTDPIEMNQIRRRQANFHIRKEI